MACQLTEVQPCSDWRHHYSRFSNTRAFPCSSHKLATSLWRTLSRSYKAISASFKIPLERSGVSPKGAPLVTLSSFPGRYSSPVVSLSASKTVSWVARRFLAHFTAGPAYLRQMIQSHEGMFSFG